MSQLLLHQWEISPYCGKIRKILRLKGLAFETCDYNGLRAAKVASLTPQGQLPVLQVGDQLIADSSRIASWLEEHHPTPALVPEDPNARAMVHFWEDWADESLYWFEIYFRFTYKDAFAKALAYLAAGRPGWEKPVVRMIVGTIYPRKVKTQGLGRKTRAEVEAEFTVHLHRLNQLLATRSWLVGAQQSLADIAVSAQFDEILRTGHLNGEIEQYQHLWAWLARNRVEDST